MKQGMRQILLAWKREIHRAGYWMILSLFPLLFLLADFFYVPRQAHEKVALYVPKEEMASLLRSELGRADSMFEYVYAQSVQEVEAQVMQGEVDCGFVVLPTLEDTLRDSIEKGTKKPVFRFLTSTTTQNGNVARETFFAAFYKIYAQLLNEDFLQENLTSPKQDFETASASARELLRIYHESQAVFAFEYKSEVKYAGLETYADTHKTALAAMLLFLVALLREGAWMMGKHNESQKMLPGQKRRYEKGYLFFVLLPCAGMALWLGLGEQQFFLYGAAALFLYVWLLGFWTLVIRKICRRAVYFLALIPFLFACALVVTPVIFPTERYIPVFGIFKWLFPVTYFIHSMQSGNMVVLLGAAAGVTFLEKRMRV